uniref:Uncharacterized protein n=1 Tax=Aegilops tauschii subsp. strangulata TaxID=200361 RepID=A0A453KYA1_AEGTS
CHQVQPDAGRQDPRSGSPPPPLPQTIFSHALVASDLFVPRSPLKSVGFVPCVLQVVSSCTSTPRRGRAAPSAL